MRAKELKEFLVSRDLPLTVWLSEDATRITGRIQYDSASNQLVGFVLPSNKQRLPISGTYEATSARKIQESFETGTISSLAYVIIAQSLAHNASSFCFSIFGTDNKFFYDDVLKRWVYIVESLRKQGIAVIGVSSDGDPRLLKGMRIISQLGKKMKNSEILMEKFSKCLIFTQNWNQT